MCSSCNTIEEKVHRYCLQQQLFDTTAAVCVAVSGGADSMALLRILQALTPVLSLQLSACHVNHALRGAAADADEAFVVAQCKTLGVPLMVYRAKDMGELPPKEAGETWARDFRYRCFALATQQQNAVLAMAHTQNDQAETLLFRLARGTGAHGAAGIRPKRGRYLRPLLCLSRAEVEQYCARVQQPYITDATNLDDRYARNHLRQHAVPSLCYANEAAVQHLGAFCEKMAEVDAYFATQAMALLQAAYVTQDVKATQGAAATQPSSLLPGDALPKLLAAQQASSTMVAECLVHFSKGEQAKLCFCLATLRQAHPLVCEQAMYQLVAPLRDAEQKYIDALCQLVQQGSGALQLTEDVRFAVVEGFLQLQRVSRTLVKMDEMTQYYPLQEGRYTFPSGFCVKVELIRLENTEKIHLVHKKDLKNYADYDKIKASLLLRCRYPGDIMTLSERGITKTIKKLYNELKIPESQRALLPLLADGQKVVWLWGQGFAQGYAPTEQTKSILRITEEKIMEEDSK